MRIRDYEEFKDATACALEMCKKGRLPEGLRLLKSLYSSLTVEHDEHDGNWYLVTEFAGRRTDLLMFEEEDVANEVGREFAQARLDIEKLRKEFRDEDFDDEYSGSSVYARSKVFKTQHFLNPISIVAEQVATGQDEPEWPRVQHGMQDGRPHAK